jgi:hypothetical protein
MISAPIETDRAIWMHMIGLFWSVVGYFTAKYASGGSGLRGDKGLYRLATSFYVLSYVIMTAGLVVSVLQVFLFVPPAEYLSQVFSSAFEATIRDIYLLPSEEEGLPGIVKMFGYAPLSIYLMSLGMLHYSAAGKRDMRRLIWLNRTALCMVAVKVLFSLDRLSIMAVVLANLFLGQSKGYLKNLRYAALAVLALLLADYLSAKRLEDVGILEFVLLYFKSGLVNFQLMIDTCTGHTYGFSTILAPLYFIFKFFNLPVPEYDSSFEWEWNPAQYFSSYAFQDFGYFYFILFYAVGALLYLIDDKATKRDIYFSAVYFVVLYGAVSFVFVPAIRGIDFWFSLLLPLALLKLFGGFVHAKPRVSPR